MRLTRHLFSLTFSLFLFGALGGASPPGCDPVDDPPLGDECTTDADCPDGRCAIGATCAAIGCPPPPPNECVPDNDACDLVRCPGGTHCELVEVVCVTEPCDPDPVAECVPDYGCEAVLCGPGTYCEVVDMEPQCVPLPGCEAIFCLPGTHCELVDVVCVTEPCDPVAECVPDYGCEAVLCGPGTYCDLVETPCGTDAPCPLEPQCVPLPGCETILCEPGSHCELVDVVCVTEPCDPVPECVPDAPHEPCTTDADCGPGGQCELGATCTALGCPPPSGECVYPHPCDTVRCAAGTHCELVDVVCITEPCDPVPECVPNECWGAWVDEAGACRSPNDGTYPAECCTPACQSDSDCPSGATCVAGVCSPPAQCPPANDARVDWMSTDPMVCAVIDFACPADRHFFSNDCGCGCVALDACDGLAEYECAADPLCDAVYGWSGCDPTGRTCTPDYTFQSCQYGF